jgi:hypothetical protein
MHTSSARRLAPSVTGDMRGRDKQLVLAWRAAGG